MGKSAASFMLAGDGQANAKSRALMTRALYVSDWEGEVREFYKQKTQELLDQKKYMLAGINYVDIVRDVSNLVHVHFCAEMFGLPLKTQAHPHYIFTEYELYLIMAAVFTTVFFDLDPAQSFKLRQVSREATQQLGKLVEDNVRAIADTGYFSRIIQYFMGEQPSVLSSYGIHLIQRLLATDHSIDDIVWGNMMATAGGMVANQGQLFAQVLDFYFNEGQKHIPDMHKLALEDGPGVDEKFMHYVLEGSRLNCGSAVFRDVQKSVVIQDSPNTLKLEKGDRLFLNFYKAGRDPKAFPDPNEVKLDRPIESYIQFGWGPHQCLGIKMTRIALAMTLKEVMKLPGLRPAKGPKGRIHKVPTASEGYYLYLTELWDGYFPFPTTMTVSWDEN